MVNVRYAALSDIVFVSQDGYVPVDTVVRKIEAGDRALLQLLEKELHAGGHRTLFSSSQADEPESQAWHRRMGFVESGRLEGVNAGGVDELFFRKELRAR